MKLNKNVLGPLLVLTAGLLWSTNAPFVRWLTLDGFSVVAIRSLIAGLVLLPFFRPQKLRFNRDLVCFLACFVLVTLGIALAIKTTGAPIAVGMQYTSGLWLFLVSRPKKKDLALSRIWPLILLSAGVVVSMCSRADNVTMLGNLIALSTGFTFAAMTHFAKKVGNENPVGLSAIANLTTGIAAAVIAVAVNPAVPKAVLSLGGREWAVLLFLGIFQIGVAYACYYSGLRYTKPTTATMLAPLEMILAPLWTAIFLHQYPDSIGLIGFVLVIAGVIGEAVRSMRQEAVHDRKS
ncbi:MAG: DMT family transporter [Ruminococcaceae bacterium]|nr:DMT family transporter [Oscillospiraceae bacterium]